MGFCRFRHRANAMLFALLGMSTSVAAQGVPHLAEIQRCDQSALARPAESIRIAQKLLAEQNLPKEARVMATGCLGLAYLASGDAEATGVLAQDLLAMLDDPQVSENVRWQSQLRAALLFNRSGKVQRAMDLLAQVQAEAARSEDPRRRMSILVAIGHLRAQDFDDPSGALPYFQQAYTLDRGLGLPPSIPSTVVGHDLGYTLFLLKRYDEADALFAEADRLAAGFPELSPMRHRIASHRAEILRAGGRARDAETRLRPLIGKFREAGDVPGEIVASQRLARSLLDQQRAQEARPIAEQAFAGAERAGLPLEQRDGLYLLADIATALGDTGAAADYAGRARGLDRNDDREKTAQQLARLQAQAARDLEPEQVFAQQDAARARMLRDLGLAALAIIALVSLALLVRTRRQKHRLAELSTIDPLTGLANRRAADGALQGLTADGRRAALLLLDVDAFKSINDRFGHDIGDAALSQIARCLREACDAGDVVARWGGEEFLVARGDTSRMAAFALAEHLRRQVERLRVDDGRGGTLSLTVSTGVSSLPVFPGDTPRWQDAIRVADRALYVAKRAGRNAWAGVWGLEAGDGVDVYSVLDNPGHALQQGWIEIGGNRPMDWSQVRPKATGGSRVGAGERHGNVGRL